MGNCLRHQQPAWVEDEDWAFLGSPERDSDQREEDNGRHKAFEKLIGKRILLHDEDYKEVCSTEVKIKITKKQVEELLRRANTTGSADFGQALVHLVIEGGAAVCHESRRPLQWTPSLESIPEVVENVNHE